MPSDARETKIFDPADGFAPFTDVAIATDSTVVKRGDQWWMYLGGKVLNREGIQLFSASLPPGAPLAAAGWKLTPDPDDLTRVAMLAPQNASAPWDLKGGRHCPSYVRGWDPERGAWVERIYYAGGAEYVWGPYTIGYLEWDGSKWIDQSAPAFVAEEDWEHGSVYEPNVIYADGKWKMWYVAGSNQEDYIVHGFAESVDGRTSWSKHQIFAPPEMKLFDFCVIQTQTGYEAVFSRVWLAKSDAPPDTGLWWCHSKEPAPELSGWSKPVQIMTAENRGWHTGPWKPSVQHSDTDPNRLLVFFDGAYIRGASPFPYAFTLGCVEIEMKEGIPRAT
jgi:hypothetical protein